MSRQQPSRFRRVEEYNSRAPPRRTIPLVSGRPAMVPVRFRLTSEYPGRFDQRAGSERHGVQWRIYPMTCQMAAMRVLRPGDLARPKGFGLFVRQMCNVLVFFKAVSPTARGGVYDSRGISMRIAEPTIPAHREAMRMPSFAAARCASLVKARPVMKSDIVNPIPASQPAP